MSALMRRGAAPPHRALIAEILGACAPALTARLRQPRLAELTDRIVDLEPSPIPLMEEDRPRQVLLVVVRALQATRGLEAEMRAASRAFTNFSILHAQLPDDGERRRLIADFLRDTVDDRRALRADLDAVQRFLGYDVIRERSAAAIAVLAACVEVALEIAAGAVHLAAGEREPGWADVAQGIAAHDGRVAELLAGGDRWQVRCAAARLLAALAGAPRGGPTGAALQALVDAVAAAGEHPWVRQAALEALMRAQPGQARAHAAALAETTAGDRPFLVRRLAIDSAAALLEPGELSALLEAVVARRDDSEHVRLGLAAALERLAPPAALALAPALAGLDDGAPEPSPRVRARAALALRWIARTAAEAGNPAAAQGAGDVLLAMVARDNDALPLVTVCEELAAIAESLALHQDALLQALAPRWRDALAALAARPGLPARVAEAAAAAIDVVDRLGDEARREVRDALVGALATLPPGRRAVVRTASWSAAARALVGDRARLGRVLAELSRRDFGLAARVRGDRLLVWRGDRLRRRLWRLVHELRNPIPNKRQGHPHTVGRVQRGDVRAHPGGLDEATATTVPGERVHADAEGSWGRHLPTVDDALDLPLLRAQPVTIASSYGHVELQPPARLAARVRARLRLSWRYRRYAQLRQSALAAAEPRQRRRFREALEAELGIRARFVPTHPRLADNPRLAALLGDGRLRSSTGAGALALATLPGAPLERARQWLDDASYYFLSPIANSQTALALFLAGVMGGTLASGWWRRRGIARARAALPLSIGGWGTRGKSGTERLKAGLFDGLGYDVFVKTTGCEAMFIHSAPGQRATEIFIYRPYDKATIWEQLDMLRLARRLRTQVFLWECMALNPRYVALLQHDWMRDDLVTLTNAYPDHEDIQGPAGIDVARVIAEFIPRRGTLITSESNFLPLFAETCRVRGTRMIDVGERDAELLADDLLALFPYREHPRNIALVARMAAELGIDPQLAIVTMADHVIADLGVLKTYPTVRVRGRLLTFVNGMSANERTGFIGNWRRVGLDRVDVDDEPGRWIMTVVNNRADRISRSEVFARILVRDIASDRNVLIGTNLVGLRGFIDDALAEYLAEAVIATGDELGGDGDLARERLAGQLARLRIPAPTARAAVTRLALYASGAGTRIAAAARPALMARLEALLADTAAGAALDIGRARRALADDRGLVTLIGESLEVTDAAARAGEDPPETVVGAERSEVVAHVVDVLARMQVRARLEAELTRALAADEPALATFHRRFRAAYQALFLDALVVIDDPTTSGDAIIDRCARAVPPGVELTVMGTQNIKGTGLDFVYRWLAVDTVAGALARLASDRADVRVAALAELDAFEDHGLVDAGWARVALARPPAYAVGAEEEALRASVRQRVEAVWAERRARLGEQRRRTMVDRIADWTEGWVDYLDSIRRQRKARRISADLVARRISHGRAALEMRQLVARQKGGWLAKALRRRS